MKRLFYLILCLSLVAGCGIDKNIEDPDEPEVPETPTAVTLELSDADLIFEAEGGEKTFTITCNTNWTITNESDWCTTDVSAGTDNQTVTVKTSSYGETEDRTTNLSIKAGDKTQVLGITQKSKDAIVPDKAKFEVPQEGGELAIKVRSNINYEVTIPEFCKSWIQPAPETRAEVSDTTYRFIISKNESDESRAGYILFSATSAQDTVRIFQAQQDRLILTQTEYNLSAKDTTIIVELKTNVEYDIMIPDSVSGWISCLPETRALRTDIVQFFIAGNDQPEVRQAVVIIKDRNSELADILHIRQFSDENPNITDKFDPEFAQMLQENGYIPNASHITLEDVNKITDLNLMNSYFPSLRGIEYFTALTTLRCDNNIRITSLNLSNNKALTTLRCDSCKLLSSLDVSNCTALTELICFGCQLSSLNISNCTALVNLICQDNQLTSLDISNCPELTTLDCQKNQLSSLDASNCTKLTYLTSSSNFQLTKLDISNCTELTDLNCSRCKLSTLDISNCMKLNNLWCFSNQLTSLDVENHTALIALDCSSNWLFELNVNRCSALGLLTCSSNRLQRLLLSTHNSLTSLRCDQNHLPMLDISRCTKLQILDCYSNELTSLDISKNTALTYLTCSNNPGNRTDLFPVTAWFNDNNIPAILTINTKEWSYNDNNITIQFIKE